MAWWRFDELGGETRGTAHTAAADEALQGVMANPESADAWTRLASAYHRAGLTLEAVSLARSAVERSPRVAAYTIPLVEALLSQAPRAIATFMEYLITSHGPSSQFSHLLGVARLKADDVPHAIEALRAACNLDQEYETYWYALGNALERQGSKDARSAYEKALRLKPSYTKARRGLERLPS